jgi:hypothetical protein
VVCWVLGQQTVSGEVCMSDFGFVVIAAYCIFLLRA